MTKLSVNVNKIATLRNARGGNVPDLVLIVKDCERFGAQGITVHPRPDERHITTKDVYDLKEIITTEFNIEGYPDKRYLNLIRDLKPIQATLVPDPPTALTSGDGWDTIANKTFLSDVIAELKSYGTRVSLFLNPDIEMVEGAKEINADRIELFTGPYAHSFLRNKESAISDYVRASSQASDLGLGINAGHDLNLDNLNFFISTIPDIEEVSIGHALISDALYYGLENTIQMYLRELKHH